jgi:hypothetical protein
VGWWVNLRIATVATSSRSFGEAISVVQGAYDMQILVDVVTTLMSSFGAIVLVLIMFRIESRARARDVEIRKSAAAPRPDPGTVAARPGGVSWEMAAGTAASQAGTTAPVPDRPVAAARTPTGPRLHLRVESPDSMMATLDGESEAITLGELPETASALARADGSAVISTSATGIGAASLAEQALRIFADAGVPTTTGH